MEAAAQIELKPKPGSCPEEVTYLEMMRTMEALSHRFAQVLKTEDLRRRSTTCCGFCAAPRRGLPCGEIGNRMVTRDSDITRLLDRLEKRALISRCRESKDRRTVMDADYAGGAGDCWRGWMNPCVRRIASGWGTLGPNGCRC